MDSKQRVRPSHSCARNELTDLEHLQVAWLKEKTAPDRCAMNPKSASLTDSEFSTIADNLLFVTEKSVTATELNPIVPNSLPVTRKPSSNHARISVAMKYGEHCGKRGQPIGRFLPVIHGSVPFQYSGPFGSGTKYLKTVLCAACAPKCHRKWNLGSCEVCMRPYYRKSQRAKHWFCCDRCEWHYRNQQARRRREPPDLRACVQCGRRFKARADSRTCSPACRQQAYRQRKCQEKPAPDNG